VYLSLRVSQGVESTREKGFTSWLRVRSLFSTWVRIGILSYLFIPKICSDLILISRLDSKIRSHANFRLNSKFRNLLNLDIHKFTLVPDKISPHEVNYPWVMTPLGNDGNDLG
jgi:hypothetical protein